LSRLGDSLTKIEAQVLQQNMPVIVYFRHVNKQLIGAEMSEHKEYNFSLLKHWTPEGLLRSSDGHTFVYSLLRYRYRYIISNAVTNKFLFSPACNEVTEAIGDLKID
jgi:hypothetical protein